MLIVVAKVVAKADSVQELRAELLKLVEPTRKEQGCIEYTLHQDHGDPAVFLFYEKWQSQADLERHMASPHFQAYVAAVEGLVADKAVHLMTIIG